MSNETAVQVSTQEEQMASMVATMVQFLTDATKPPTLRKEIESLRTECESLKRANEELKIEVGLEREDKEAAKRARNEAQDRALKLDSRLASLQHKFDTIQGIVAAAMAEARDEPKTDPTPWTPSVPLRSVY
jgi:FtsZ-binding cell division protein ZapB